MKKLIILLFILLTNLDAYGKEAVNNIFYRFPCLYNSNPVSGRLYLQPLGVHEDQVIKGTTVDLSFGSSAEYNRYFMSDPQAVKEESLTVNTNIYSLKLSHYLLFLGIGIETGGIFRAHQDIKNTLLADFLDSFHDWSEDTLDFNGHSPPNDRYYGSIGDGNTVVIGKSGNIFLSTIQLYSKIQLMDDKGPKFLTPNVSIKFSTRIPTSNKNFDKIGVGFSSGISKELFKWINFIGAFDIVFQNLEAHDFNASNIDVKKVVYDIFAGFVLDMGKTGGWYNNIGMRFSPARIRYSDNPDSADDAYVLHYGIVYNKSLKNNKIIEIFINLNEDLPDFGHCLEPDFRIQCGVSLMP